MSRWLEIFRTGLHTDMSGATLSFSAADLDQVVAGYNPKQHEAPVVIGHPKTNAPAWGWVKGLRRKGEVLEANVDQLHPAFAEALKTSQYKKRSASFYLPKSPGNPTPGKMSLRHVGFLGAMPPAVKGLEDVSFAGSAGTTFEFADGGLGDAARAVLAKFSALAASSLADDPEAAALQAELEQLVAAADAEVTTQGADAAAEVAAAATEVASEAASDVTDALEGFTDEQKATVAKLIEQAVATRAAEAAAGASTDMSERASKKTPREVALERELAAMREEKRRSRRAEHVAFCEGLVKGGRPLPVSQADAATLLEIVSDVDASTVSFASEGATALSTLRSLMNALPKQVEFAEISRPTTPAERSDSATIARKATEYQAEQERAGRPISTAEAVRHVTHGGSL